MNTSLRPRLARTFAAVALASLALAGLVPAASAVTPTAPARVTAPSAHTHTSETTTASGLRDPDGNVVVVDPWQGDARRANRAGGAVAAALDLASTVAAAPKAKKKLKTLVVPVYWSGAGKDKVTTKKLKTMMTKVDAYFRTVSDGRIGHSSKILGWVKIPKPSTKCGLFPQMGHLVKHVEAAAKKKGIKASKYDRIITYVTSKACAGTTPPEAGVGSMPGRYTWLNGFTDTDIVTHELGHNLGLEHANYAECASSKSKRITFGKTKQCTMVEYGDTTDTMGAFGINGWFSGPRLAALGWLTKSQLKSNTSGKKKTYTLVPVAKAAKGVKALKIKASKTRTYWVEYRTATGLDKGLAAEGIQVRVNDGKLGEGGTRSAILDMYPTTSPKLSGFFNLDDWRDVTLRKGSSWTSPEGIQITFSSVKSGKAKVTVARKAKAAKPSTPSTVKATNGDRKLHVTWKRPKDKGMPITAYKLTATSTTGAKKTATIHSPGGTITSGVVPGLTNGQTYTVSVAAVTEKGTSSARKSAATKVAAIVPRVTFLSPTAGAVVGGTLTVDLRTQKGVGGTPELEDLKVCLDAEMAMWCEFVTRWDGGLKDGGTTRVTIDMTQVWDVVDGPVTIYAELTDEAGRTGKAKRTVTLQRAGTVSVTSMPSVLTAGATATATITPRPGIPDTSATVSATISYTHPEEGSRTVDWTATANDARTQFTFTWNEWMTQYSGEAAEVPATVTVTYESTYLGTPVTVTKSTKVDLVAYW